MRLLFLTLSLLCSLTSQAITLSGTARISLMTVAPGAELYSTFGHSALRVFDPERGLDKIYNYGTFDFDQPHFYLNFVRGRLFYSLATESFRSFEYGNRLEQRQMKEQVLALRLDQKQRLFDLLEENATPANRDYLYDFFYDNCATRIRDILQKATADSLQWEPNQLPEGTTLRDLLGFYLTEHPWTQFGINLVLGKPTDRLADTYSSMFLPDYLHDAVSGARFLNGQSLLFAENVGPDYPRIEATSSNAWWRHPFLMTGILLVMGIAGRLRPGFGRFFEPVFWFILGLAGTVMATLWFLTDHQATKWNFNLLWALPTHLLFFTQAARSKLSKFHAYMASFLAGICLVVWMVLPQELPLESLPIVVLVILLGVWHPDRA